MTEISKQALSEVELLKEIYKKLAGENPALDLNKALSKASLLRGIADIVKVIPADLPTGLSTITQMSIVNGDVLAENVSPDVLFIDTEVVTDDISVTGLTIDLPGNYVFIRLESIIGAENTVTDIAFAGGLLTATDNIAPGFRSVLRFEKSMIIA